MSRLAPMPFPCPLTPCRLCTMYIPRPAKLLFQHDDGWSRYLDKHGDTLSDWNQLAVERMLACGTCAMGVRRYCCASPDCPHTRFFCQSCKSKACSSCGLKATEQWIAEQQHILPDCDWPGLGHIRSEGRWHRYLHAQYRRCWKVHFAKKTRGAWRSVKYLGRYLKRPPVAASQLRHYRGGAVVHQYYDHRTQQHKRQKISQEEMLQRYVSHIPARHFKMVQYYGFLANRKRGTLLPKVYDALEMTVREKPKRPGFAVLMKSFLGTAPYQCILCKGRLRFTGAMAGEHATNLLSDRLHRLAKKRWLQIPSLD